MNAFDLGEMAAQLDELDGRSLRRRRRVVQQVDGPRMVVDGESLLAFCSNDYLGLAQHPDLIAAAQRGAQQYGVGATASPLVCGHTAAHDALERELAAFVGLPAALSFYAGFAANVGLLPALVGRGDALFCDALNHACLIDGARLSGAQIAVYPHGDLAALAERLAASTAERKLVVTDAVFSMDGDLAPLPELLALCERHDAWLLIDDAHGFGVLGPEGRGSAAHFGLQSKRLIYMATLGKAAGVAGAFVAGDDTLIDWLLQRTRSYIFATAMPAMQAEALRESLRVMQREPQRRAHVMALVQRLRAGLAELPWANPPSPTPVQPLILGGNAEALAMAAALRERGLWVPAIRPPTVPVGSARLRITLSAAHTEADVDRLLGALREIAERRRTCPSNHEGDPHV
jgi:8-amino-7-oxononanoate synthase